MAKISLDFVMISLNMYWIYIAHTRENKKNISTLVQIQILNWNLNRENVEENKERLQQ